MREPKLDEVGYWSEVKLAIIREYASAYSTILAKQQMRHLYVDGFAGAGIHISKASHDFIPGSPLNALNVKPPFAEFHLIDLDSGKAANLRSLVGDRLNEDVFVYEGDCNQILLDRVFPRCRYEDFRRALCILDPYGLHLNWKVIETAGRLGTIDLFLNFPIMDMNMNALWNRPDGANQAQKERMTSYWGDTSWEQAAYRQEATLFGDEPVKEENDKVAEAFRQRLKGAAGFKNVIQPIPMRNNQGATVYYLYFASQNTTGNKIAAAIFNKYKDAGRIHG